jgi:outer membrane protein OmpA-like peptidoglycan-associated protein
VPDAIRPQTIDSERAEVVKNILIKKGLDESRIHAKGMGESTIDDYNDLITMYDADLNETIYYNRNMRVEVKIIKY